jgi:TPR repeat protein
MAGAFPLVSVPATQAQDFQFPVVERMAREQKNLGAFGVLSLYFRYGYGTPQNLLHAAEVIPVEAAGHPFSQYNMGVLLLNRAAAVENEAVANLFREQAERLFRQSVPGLQMLSEQDDPVAQLLLGGCYEAGRGVSTDLTKAFDLYHASAKSGFPLAWSNLADLLIKGRGTPKDLESGIRLMEKAAEAGVPMAKYSLAQAYLSGTGVKKSPQTAVALLKEAADVDQHQLAMSELANFYLDGSYVGRNEQLGMDYLRKAVQLYSVEAVRRARRMGYTVEISEHFPESFAVALSGQAQQIALRPLFGPKAGDHAGQVAAGSPASLVSPREAPSQGKPTPPLPPPGFADFQKRFAAKSGSAFQQVQRALLEALKEPNPTPAAVFQRLSSSSGKATDWLEETFAPENVLLRENADWAALILPDKSFAYSVIDLPNKLLPLWQEKRNSEALRTVRSWSRDWPSISPAMDEAWQQSFNELETLLSQQVMASEDLRAESAQAATANREKAALELLSQAMEKDLRPEDENRVRELEEKIKQRAFQDTGL